VSSLLTQLQYSSILFIYFIHSYSFNVQVDITQLLTDRQERKTELFIYVQNYVVVSSY